MRTTLTLVLVSILAFTSPWASATRLTIEAPFYSITGTSYAVSSRVRNLDTARSELSRLEAWVFPENYDGGSLASGFRLATDLSTRLAAGYQLIHGFGGTLRSPPDGAWVVAVLLTEQDGGAENGGYSPRAWANFQPMVFSGGGGRNYTGLWWNPSESGWGLNVNHQGILVFATLFTYATDGAPMWLVGSALARQADGSFAGPLYRTAGPTFNQVPWVQPAVAEVGTMALRFDSTSLGTLSYSVNNVAVMKLIQPQVFAGNTVCGNASAGPSGGATSASNFQDLWWNPQESGWGVNLTHQGNTIFATLFTYAGGRDKWFVASSMARQSDGSFLGALYETSGPSFNASPFAGVSVREVGTATASFSTASAGTLSYSVNGVSVTRPIQRQRFSSPVPSCR